MPSFHRWLIQGFERIDPGFPAGGLDQQLGHVGFAGEPPHSVAIQAERTADGAEGILGCQEFADGGMAFAGPRNQAPLMAAHIAGL
jgi:hypothetical protein